MMQDSAIDEISDPVTRVGSTLHGKWHLDGLIGVGGMAAVYAATHSSGVRSAIKILHAGTSPTPEVACAFLREDHPNAVHVLEDDVDDDGNVCVVMELLHGGNLRECAVAAGGRLAPDRVLRILDQVLEGLAGLHDAGIVHRDIKPANLFLTTSGRVKILDFGLASLREQTTESPSAIGLGVTTGTPNFMSPEQTRGRWDLVNAQSDLWSLGATAFMLLSGRAVQVQASIPELLVASFGRAAPSLATVLPGAHAALVDLIDRALRRDLGDRWRDARTMQAAVRAAFRAMYDKPLPPLASADPVPAVTLEAIGHSLLN